jgi:hypothetical protein
LILSTCAFFSSMWSRVSSRPWTSPTQAVLPRLREQIVGVLLDLQQPRELLRVHAQHRAADARVLVRTVASAAA